MANSRQREDWQTDQNWANLAELAGVSRLSRSMLRRRNLGSPRPLTSLGMVARLATKRTGGLAPSIETSQIEMQSLFPFLLVFIVVGAVSAAIVLRPIARAVQGRRNCERFYVVDMVALLFLLQLPFVFLSMASRAHGAADVALTGGFLVLMVIAIWWRGVSLLSTLGVAQNLRRFFFTTLFLPLSLLGSLGVAPFLYWLWVDNLSQESLATIAKVILSGAIPFYLLAMRSCILWVIQDADGIELKSSTTSTH